MDNKINVSNYKSKETKIYSGKPRGESVRRQLGLNEKDQDSNVYTFHFPKDTMSINSSFFGGLFEESVIHLGRKKFEQKYRFFYDGDKELSDILKFNIEEGIGDALREY